ncbi:hypothetical protein GCM10010326_19340 [Streptomyces xanthochromogenes]|uniref:DUF1989 domain-containing protein n=1 Tax=Streptomyces xanthochromogenes TaxID=67384 RepID=A0ABQ2ZV21_9ACTN|nr:hypothetical protein GCM10010326_19340 [Streptomyces xanthochromogenes]
MWSFGTGGLDGRSVREHVLAEPGGECSIRVRQNLIGYEDESSKNRVHLDVSANRVALITPNCPYIGTSPSYGS